MNTVLWVLALFGLLAAVCTFVAFAGGAMVAWIADMTTDRGADE